VQGVPDSEENAENQSDEEAAANERGKDKKEKDAKKESETKGKKKKVWSVWWQCVPVTVVIFIKLFIQDFYCKV